MFTPRTFGSAFQGKKVLLTGHTGFKGAWLATWLVQLGAEVTGLSLPGEYALFDQLKLPAKMTDRRGDIRELSVVWESVEKTRPDFIFHLAAQALVRVSYRNPLITHETNVLGTANLLESVRVLNRACTVVCVTTDKCYQNRESSQAYAEEDALGGHDPYSASKAAAEIVIASYRDSFFPVGSEVRVASARAGNVIGGGDWAEDRIVPDCIRALAKKETIAVRNPGSTRPWQHVLEPLSGYLTLAAKLCGEPENLALASAFNFGPGPAANRNVRELVEAILQHWPGAWKEFGDVDAPHEAGKLNLATDKAFQLLGWHPVWPFEETIRQTIEWYRCQREGRNAWDLTTSQIQDYVKAAA